MKQLGEPKVFKYITLNISGYIKLIPYTVIKYTQSSSDVKGVQRIERDRRWESCLIKYEI